ncbi:MAG: YopX family protein [Eubacteriales bacterium]|nr:YopX family protein [Eubacteriales bacterium]
MREILFRGKRVDNGEWVYGDFLTDGIDYTTAIRVHNANGFGTVIAVIPETVGQYTGLPDKNGKKIFEGDIVKTKKYGKIIEHSCVNDYDIFKVVYEPCVFRLKNAHRGFNLVGNGVEYEVIGNIHDNPELLKGE